MQVVLRDGAVSSKSAATCVPCGPRSGTRQAGRGPPGVVGFVVSLLGQSVSSKSNNNRSNSSDKHATATHLLRELARRSHDQHSRLAAGLQATRARSEQLLDHRDSKRQGLSHPRARPADEVFASSDVLVRLGLKRRCSKAVASGCVRVIVLRNRCCFLCTQNPETGRQMLSSREATDCRSGGRGGEGGRGGDGSLYPTDDGGVMGSRGHNAYLNGEKRGDASLLQVSLSGLADVELVDAWVLHSRSLDEHAQPTSIPHPASHGVGYFVERTPEIRELHTMGVGNGTHGGGTKKGLVVVRQLISYLRS